MEYWEIGKLTPNKHLRRILRLPGQKFTRYEYESGETRIEEDEE